MGASLFDPSWYRVAAVKPRLRDHAEFHRHHYRGERWYVLQDHTSERFHRFTPSAYQVIGLIDGHRSVQQIWDLLVEHNADNVPTQSEIIRLLGQLHSADVLMADVSPDVEELFQRHQKRQSSQRWQKLKTPLAIRIPLFDPDKFLSATNFIGKAVFSKFGALIWLSVVMVAAFLALQHWPDLTENITEKVLSPQNLLLLWLTFPLVKACHEFGHAYATKAWGGEVHEMGVMLLVLMPIPYVDASAASAFRSRHRRVIVGAAGMMVEVFLAALALFVWLNIEPGFARAIAYNVMLIAGVSTILFNGNPLLRFDGYYIFADAIEIPNLAARANKYLSYLTQKYLFGLKQADSPVLNDSEKPWFAFFAIASFIYRMMIYWVIVLFIAGKFFFIGVLLAIWAAGNMIVWPLLKGLWFVIGGSQIRAHRPRAISTTAIAIAVIVTLVAIIPMPYYSRAEGVVWIPDRAIIRAGTAGFVDKILVAEGAEVAADEPIIQLRDSSLSARITVLENQLAAAEARRRALLADEYAKAQIADEEVERVLDRLANYREREAKLLVKAPVAGHVHLPKAQDLAGRYFNQGMEIGYLIEPSTPTIRVAVTQHDIDMVRDRTAAVEVRSITDVDKRLPARVVREVPAATNQLPSAALGMIGGGEIATDPSGANGVKALEDVFLFDLTVLDQTSIERMGERVYVRFEHAATPLVNRWYRSLRQLLLGRFDV